MQERDQYVYFTIKLLKGSFAVNALWQDAMNYHMIDQPDKLIALRLTEYYELVNRGELRPGPSALGAVPVPTPGFAGNNAVPPNQVNATTRLPEFQSQNGQPGENTRELDPLEQSAEEAADYWAPL
jgi:hypothetical protein